MHLKGMRVVRGDIHAIWQKRYFCPKGDSAVLGRKSYALTSTISSTSGAIMSLRFRPGSGTIYVYVCVHHADVSYVAARPDMRE